LYNIETRIRFAVSGENLMADRCALGAAISFALIAASPALAQTKPPGFACGGSPPQMVTVSPVPKFTVIDFDNRGADCALWQTFF